MKTLKSAFILSLTLFVLISSTSFASNAKEKTTDKTREAVESAGPDDWHTLAICAEKCFKKNVNMNEAVKWLNQSLKIAKKPLNLELQGDYYMMNKLPEKALKSYISAMNILKEENNLADFSKLQKKVSKITNIGG